MNFIFIILGLTYVGIGYLAKKYPNLIAGYNSMSASQKNEIDIDGLSSTMKKIFVYTGYIIAVIGSILSWMKQYEYATLFLLVALFCSAILIFVKTAKYFPKKKHRFENQ